MKNKRGMSDIVSTMLIILIVIASVAIIGTIVLRIVNTSSERIEAGSSSVSFQIVPQSVQITDGAVSGTKDVKFILSRKAGAGDVVAAQVILKDSTGKTDSQKLTAGFDIKELETKPVSITSTANSISDLASIEVIPILLSSKGNEIQSNIKYEYKISGAEGTEPPACYPDCLSGQTRCQSSLVQNCGEANDEDTCLDWLTAVSCPSGQTCSGETCSGGTSGIPTILTLTVSQGPSVTLTWTTVSGATGYKVYQSSTETGQYLSLTTSPIPGQSYTVNSPCTAEECFYKVSAVNSAGTEGSQSASAKASVFAYRSLLAYWKLDDASDAISFADSSGYNHPGTCSGSYCPDYVSAGKYGGARQFNGVNDYISVPYTVQNNVIAYTIAVWVKTTDAGAQKVFVHNRGTNAKSLTLGIGTTGGGRGGAGKVGFEADGDGLDIGISSSTQTINDGTWHHVVGTWAASSGTAVTVSQFKIYIDGVEAAVTTRAIGSATSPLSGTGNMGIGTHPWATYFNGEIDEVMVWNRVLSQTEIGKLNDYNNFKV